MIDTIKLLIKVIDPLKLKGDMFAPITLEQLVNSRPGSRTYLNTSKIYAKTGQYMPNLTMFKRYINGCPVYQLTVEFSAPKMLFGNNFDELSEGDFSSLVDILQCKLEILIGIKFFKSQIEQADVGSFHPSKNIIFLDYTSCQTVINTISKLDISKTYDVQKTDFRDGHVLHIHCNSMDIAFYDKMADMQKSKISSKRAIEKDNLLQLNIFEMLANVRPLEVFRYEIRLNGRDKIKRTFPDLKIWTFETMFKKQLCQDILTRYWEKITGSIDMIALDCQKPFELFQNYLNDNPDADPKSSLAAVASLLIIAEEGAESLRYTLDARFGKQVWYRLKPTIRTPGANRFKAFMHIEEALKIFKPTNMSILKNSIDNNVK